MKLADYLNSCSTGNALAAALGVPDALVSQWKSGTRQIPAARCPAIEKATNGAVRCEDLRSDVDWGYLRDSKKVGAGDTVKA